MIVKDYFQAEDVFLKLRNLRDSLRIHHKHLAANAMDMAMMEMRKVKAVHPGSGVQMVDTVAANKDETTKVPEIVPFGEGFSIGHMVLRCGKCNQRVSAEDVYCRKCGRLFVKNEY